MTIFFFISLAAAASAAFIALTGQQLPAVVAAHFDAAGRPDGFWPRNAYLGLMMALAVLLPTGMAALGRLASRLPPEWVSLPNRDHWLHPDRRRDTARSLSAWLAVFGFAVCGLLCLAHWLIVQAHAVSPPRLEMRLLFIGTLGFLVFVAGWTIGFFRRFGKAGVDTASRPFV